jgi:APA family basic amino acid/polyamine antiporter
MSLFRRKPIADLVVDDADHTRSLKRVLGAGDLVMLAIGAVIGAGIFGAIGTAAAGQVGPDGVVIRYGAGPALVFSFLLLGGACALAALCYAELASMIPQAGSAYAYTYATLGEAVAWIIGWDLILEYAVGNVAVAISWGDYFTTLMRGIGVDLPAWLTTGYRTALLSSNPDVQGLLQTAPQVAGFPILLNLPAFGIVAFVTWLLLRGARESSRANNIMVVIKLLALGLFIAVGLTSLDADNYTPFAPNGFTGIHQGAAIVFFAYIGFDAISTAAEETRDPQRNLPIGILGGLAICTLIYVVVGFVLTGMVPYTALADSADPLAYALQAAGYSRVGWIVALGAAISMTAVLLVFQYGQPRIFFAMARDGLLPAWAARLNPKTRIPSTTTMITGAVVALGAMVGDAAETYDLTNIGTLFAFALVCIGVLVLRVVEPERPRPFRVPLVWAIAPLGTAACLFIMVGLPYQAWERFALWLGVGILLYFAYGYSHSKLRRSPTT